MKTILEISKKQFIEWTKGIPGPIQGPSKETYSVLDERFFERLENALERKSNCILYGPPGTGKTFLARKYISWKAEKDNVLHNAENQGPKFWMMIASSKYDFKWEDILSNKGTVHYELKSVYRNFKIAKKGDKVLCYSARDNKAFVGIAEIIKSFDGSNLSVQGLKAFSEPIPFEEVKEIPEYKNTQAGRMGNRGTMFEINEDFVNWIKDYLFEAGDSEAAKLMGDIRTAKRVEMCTFHPSFNYEDFIEGYKPVSSGSGQINFKLEEGIFKRLCQKAQENSNLPYYLIIDEINRGNVPKIFGEIITLLEKDKRGVEVTLPQSKDTFLIPDNLYIIATMNTSDRSIKMMDAALKRRFAFIECMPDIDLINHKLDGLGLSPGEILQKINQKLVALGGRDKQIGHAYLMKNGDQISTIKDLKEIYEMEIIPLVQDYCFDDYSQLAEIIGEGFIDSENMVINTGIFSDSDDIFISEIIKQFQG